MTREEREAAIAYIKGYRKLDEDLHNTAPKDSISYYATDKCLKYWDIAIQALSQKSGKWIDIPDNATNGEVIQALFPNIDKGFSNVIDLNLWWNAKYKTERR